MARRQRLGIHDIEAGTGQPPSFSAFTSSSVTTLGPRATLMKYAVGFSTAKNFWS